MFSLLVYPRHIDEDSTLIGYFRLGLRRGIFVIYMTQVDRKTKNEFGRERNQVRTKALAA